MVADDIRHADIIDLLNNIDLAYAFKKRRLRYLESGSVNSEVVYLRDNFNRIWDTNDNLYYLKDRALSGTTIEILYGLLGECDRATVMLNSNRALASLGREQMYDFFRLHIASGAAQKNFLSILFDGDDSLISLAGRQIPYLERYLPTMDKINKRELSAIPFSQLDLDNFSNFISKIDDIEQNLSLDIRRYKEFARDFPRLYREDAQITVVGYGEISTVMRLKKEKKIRADIVENESRWIWKKMPPFPTREDVDRYLQLYKEYRRILTADIGITVPEQTARYFRHETYYLVYAGQERIDPERICNIVIKKLDEQDANRLLLIVLHKLGDVYAFNSKNNNMKIGIDAQLSNWALESATGPGTVADDDRITYIDTTSPMIRINGIEQIDPEIFIKSAASFLRPVIRKFFLRQVLDRYYDFRLVIIDLIANLHKEKRSDLIDGFIKTTNDFFNSRDTGTEEITRKEIDAYYSNDAFIWKFYQASRKIDRFITQRILRKRYMFRIPGKIAR